jgi:hypothetical protein
MPYTKNPLKEKVMRKKELLFFLILAIGFGFVFLGCQTSTVNEGKYIPG